MDKQQKIAILQSAIVIINMGTYQNEQSDMESTVFGYCNGCGAIEYMEHDSDCEVVAVIDDLTALRRSIKAEE